MRSKGRWKKVITEEPLIDTCAKRVKLEQVCWSTELKYKISARQHWLGLSF